MQCLCLMSQRIPRGTRNCSTLKDLIMQWGKSSRGEKINIQMNIILGRI